MPNNCENKLYIRGPKEDLAKFRHFARGFGWLWTNSFDEAEPNYDNHCELDLYKFIKPHNHAPTDFNDYGYDWCVENHGTKWGCYDINVHGGPYPSDDNRKPWDLIYVFTTAWSPFNERVFETMCREFINLDFLLKYYEGGCDLCGYYLWQDGDLTVSNETITENLPIPFPAKTYDVEDYNEKTDEYCHLEALFNEAWMNGEIY